MRTLPLNPIDRFVLAEACPNISGMSDLIIWGQTPDPSLIDAIYVAAEVLDEWICYAHEGRYHFSLGGGWSLALSADSADRIRIESCRLTRPVTTMWTPARQRSRLAGLVRKMSTVPETV
jgi:hypothetical protein